MNEETIPKTVASVIDIMAEKFGKKAEDLWNVLIFQWKLRGVLWLIIAVVLFISGLALFPLLKSIDVSNCPDLSMTCESNGGSMLAWMMVIADAIATISFVYHGVLALGNPAYKAVEDLLAIKRD